MHGRTAPTGSLAAPAPVWPPSLEALARAVISLSCFSIRALTVCDIKDPKEQWSRSRFRNQRDSVFLWASSSIHTSWGLRRRWQRSECIFYLYMEVAMRAVVLHQYGGPEKLKFEDNVPEPQISGNTVLIGAAAASVNPIDWKLRSGMRQKDFPLSFPAILGRDVSGGVRAVGANVKQFKDGDRVLAFSNATYAELVAVDDSSVTHLPDGVDLADAAAIPLIALTGDQLVRLATNGKKGQVVLITGALGSVGRAAVHTAKKVGAQVIAGVRGKELDDARSLGVSDVLAIDDDKAIEKEVLQT